MFDPRAGCWVFEELHLCFEYNNRFPIEFGVGAGTAQLGGGGGGGGGGFECLPCKGLSIWTFGNAISSHVEELLWDILDPNETKVRMP
jgi:hypothetical protein